ncbi:MAG: type II CRISPR-associated endonuclease Cas1 [Thermoproteales archaeon]|nr:type II CRISPR-associated endonuclease Cas1 [Thermoproteales archaeon]
MIEHIIDISEEPARLSVRLDLLVIEQEKNGKVTIPLSEVAVLVVSHPQVSLTHHVLSGLTGSGGVFVACDDKHLPVGMMLPIVGNFAQAERFALQARAPLPVKKRCWQKIIQAKVSAQARLLDKLYGDDRGIGLLARKVKSGDSTNIEGQASKRYWPALFADPGFRRDRFAEDQNRLLNYGYAVLRAIVARAIVGSGLHPSLGIHHHNRYDAFCLADDLMEPFRPLVDSAVALWVKDHDPESPLDRKSKEAMISALTRRFNLDGELRTLFDIVGKTASSLALIFAGKTKKLILPKI